MRNYNDAHRLFLQVFVSKRLLSQKDAENIYLQIGERLERDTPPDKLNEFIQMINKELSPFFMEIRNGRSEENGARYYALVNNLEDESSKLGTDFTAQEIELIKKCLETIVLSQDGLVSSLDLINLVHDLPKKLTPQTAQEILDKLTSREWLSDIKGDVCFGPRLLIELGQYLEEKYKDAITVCDLCHSVVIMGDACIHCDKKIHRYCAAMKFRGVPAERRKCISCKDTWENDLIKLPEETTPQACPEETNGVASSSSQRAGRRSSRR